jgi:hypothetical protein
MINQNIKEEITAAAYTAINLPANTGCSGFSLWTEDGAPYYIASTSDGVLDGIKVTSDGTKVLPLTLSHAEGKAATGTILCYAKGTSTTNLVGVTVK